MENADSFRINLYRVGEKSMPDGENSEKDGENIDSGSERAARSSVLSVKTDDLSVKKPELSVKNIGVVGEKAHMMDRMITKLTDNPKATATALSEELSISKRTIERYFKELRDLGILIRHGPDKGGYWEVILKD